MRLVLPSRAKAHAVEVPASQLTCETSVISYTIQKKGKRLHQPVVSDIGALVLPHKQYLTVISKYFVGRVVRPEQDHPVRCPVTPGPRLESSLVRCSLLLLCVRG